ncbi:SDR family NAD(P)-dependent oxidoreductase [Hoeflea sp.]|uniref:SDR family NAD(P)-dependent oxidoreductase n=1 Tax=Hoeflea sp. TaxID=1940281 RepID=UPI003B01AB8A
MQPGKNAIVTGGASGIGLAVVRSLTSNGFHVFTLDRQARFQEDLTDAQAASVTFMQADLADPAAIEAAFTGIRRETSEIALLVNNAGIADACLIEDLTLAEWTNVFSVNLTAALLCIQKTLPLMRAAGGGSIINISSLAGKRMSYNGGVAYTASKTGLLGLTRHAAFEFARDNIRVNAICPGPVLTPMIFNSTSQAQRDGATEKLPLGEWVLPDDIAQAVLFLAGSASAKVTGTTLDVDSGFLVSNGAPYQDYVEHRSRSG